jgi:hypothetical protein
MENNTSSSEQKKIWQKKRRKNVEKLEFDFPFWSLLGSSRKNSVPGMAQQLLRQQQKASISGSNTCKGMVDPKVKSKKTSLERYSFLHFHDDLRSEEMCEKKHTSLLCSSALLLA